MKIAVASEGNSVTEHFGHCENFIIYEVKDNKVTDKKIIPNPGHKPGFLPNFLNGQGVNVIISGGMGGGAVDIFNELNIKVITGAAGNADLVVQNYILGELKSTNSVCREHQHKDECHN